MGNVVVCDTDALIALTLETDPHHQKAINISHNLLRQGVSIIFPATVFPEAITTLKRAFNQSEKARLINTQYQQGVFEVEYIDQEIMGRASRIFDKTNSKQNTFFDAIVAATAEKLGTKEIFSFDNWYPKLGLKLVREN